MSDGGVVRGKCDWWGSIGFWYPRVTCQRSAVRNGRSGQRNTGESRDMSAMSALSFTVATDHLIFGATHEYTFYRFADASDAKRQWQRLGEANLVAAQICDEDVMEMRNSDRALV
jgi:hypothetical protein